MELKEGLCDWCGQRPATMAHGLVIHAAYLRGSCAAWAGNEPTQVCDQCAQKIVALLEERKLWEPIPKISSPVSFVKKLFGGKPVASFQKHWDRAPRNVICDLCASENFYCAVAYIFELGGKRVDLSFDCAKKIGITTAIHRDKDEESPLFAAEEVA